MLLLLPILVPLIGGIFVFRQKNETYRDWLVVTLIVITAVMVLANCTMPTQRLWLLTIQGDLGLVLNSDWLSKFFMVLAVCIWAPVVVFTKPSSAMRGRASQFMGFLYHDAGGTDGPCSAANFVTMYMFFEMTVPDYRCRWCCTNATPRPAGQASKYFGVFRIRRGHGPGRLLLYRLLLDGAGFSAGGAIDFSRAAEHQPLLLVAYCLMIVGFGAKAGMMPMQSWLPAAHPVAPAPASAVLSGVITKGGVVAVIRVTYYMFGPEFLAGSWPQYVLLTLTLATVFVGSMLAYREKQLKRRLAYSTVSQVSYVLFGLMLLTPDGVQASLLQMVFHALAKDTLFLAAGAIIFSTNCTRVDQLRGIGRRMPVTMWCFTLAALSLIGIPPMAGFVSKWYLLTASLEAPIQAFGVAGLVVLVVSALLTAGYLLPVVTEGFFPGRDFITERREVGVQMTWPMIAFAAAVVLMGLLPGGLLHWLGLLAARLFP